MLYNDPLSLYPMSFVNPNMYMNMFQCCISDRNRIRETAQNAQIQNVANSINREILTSKINCLNDITYYAEQNAQIQNVANSIYADNIPVVSLNEDEITIIHDQPKNKLTIYDLNQLIFPFDPIRDWVEKKTKEINEKYSWTNSL